MPYSDSKVSFGSKKLRAWSAACFLKDGGLNINIEKGANIG